MYFNERKEKNRLEVSWKDSKQQIEYFKAKNGDLVAKNNVLQLKYSELKNVYPEIIAEIKNLKVNPRRVEHFSETVIQQQKDIITTLKDSLIYDTISVRVFNYHDEFYTIKGIAIGDTQKVHIESRDSLIQVVLKGDRYKPWLWIFSKRKLQQVVSCKNPNSKIVFSSIIELRE
jgi:regulator of replication initiation timing